MHMMAVGDESAEASGIGQGCTYHAGLAAVHLAHGIEQMRERTRPGS